MNIDPEVLEEAVIYDEMGDGVPIDAVSFDDNAARIPSGIDSVVIHSTNYGSDGCTFDDVTKMINEPGTDEYNGLLRRELIIPGTHITYNVISHDGVGLTAEQPPSGSFHVWVTNPGDPNVDGRITRTDLDIGCECYDDDVEPWLEDYMYFFSDYDRDGDVDFSDMIGIHSHIGTRFWNLKRACTHQELVDVGDIIGLDIGAGQPGSTGVVVPVYLENDSTEIRSILYELAFDENVFHLASTSKTQRTSSFDYIALCVGQTQEMVGIKGPDTYLSTQYGGSPSIMNLSFDIAQDAPRGSYHLTLTEGDISDTTFMKVADHHYRGKFFVGEAPPVSIVCTPVSDTSLVRGDTLVFHTRLTNHHWQGVTASVYMYGTVTPEGMNPFLVVDTTHVFIPQGGKVTTLTSLEVPQYAPLVHYEFTGYVGEVQTTYDTDTFGFHVSDTLGMMGGGGPELASTGTEWRLLSGWFGSALEKRGNSLAPELSNIPRAFSLSQNFPNPFNPVTEITYAIPEREHGGVKVSIMVYDVRGHLIRKFDEGSKVPGRYSILWDGRNNAGGRVSSGVYFYHIQAGSFAATRKMVMMK